MQMLLVELKLHGMYLALGISWSQENIGSSCLHSVILEQMSRWLFLI